MLNAAYKYFWIVGTHAYFSQEYLTFLGMDAMFN